MSRLILLSLASLLTVGALASEDAVTFDGDVELAYGYDTNVSVDDVDLSTDVGDQFADLSVSGGVNFETRNETEFSARLTLTEKHYQTFDQFDGSLMLASLSANRDVGRFNLGMSLRHVDYRLDNEGFLSLQRVSPTLSWFPGKKTYLRLGYEYSDERYDASNTRDNESHQISASIYYFISGLRHYLMLRLQVAEEDAETSVFNNDTRAVRLSYQKRITLLTRDSTFKLGYRYQTRNYDDAVNLNLVDGRYREDRRHRYDIELEVPLSQHWELSAKVSSSDYRSNLAAADYSQEIYQLTIKYKF